jgi:acyl-CoA synthetase (AMP-forming)/AMP-acid ligase II
MESPARTVDHWIENPPPGRFVYFASNTSAWQKHPYAELAELAMQIAHGVHRAGVRRNDAVAILSPLTARFIGALFGTMRAGATPVVIAPPRAFQDVKAYERHLLAVAESASLRLILTTPELEPVLSSVPGLGIEIMTTDDALAEGQGANAPPRRGDLALLQFTSGTTAQAHGVAVPYRHLETNVAAIRQWLEWTRDDAAAFWLPHYHDMGLIGGIISPLVSQCDTWLLTPELFVRSPLTYLRCFGTYGARLTALPGFGLDYITRRVRREDLRGMDFSGVKAFVVGSELVHAATLRAFSDLLEPVGLPRQALLPAYGLAEATLAVTGVPLGSMWAARAPADGGPTFVGCGPPVSDVRVVIVDEQGQPVADGRIGEIAIRGVSVNAGHPLSESPERSEADEWFLSGDAGFMADGQLFPVGRMGDSIKIRGRHLFAEQLDGELHRLGHSREHNTVLLGMRHGRAVLVWIAERSVRGDSGEALRLLSRLAEGADVALVDIGRGGIPRTTSGKPRRRVLWRDFIGGRFSDRVTVFSEGRN